MAVNAEFANYTEGASMPTGGAIVQWAAVKMATGNIVVATAVGDFPFSVATRAAAASGEVIPVAKAGSFVWVKTGAAIAINLHVTAAALGVVAAMTGTGVIGLLGFMMTATAGASELGILYLAPQIYNKP